MLDDRINKELPLNNGPAVIPAGTSVILDTRVLSKLVAKLRVRNSTLRLKALR
jgi:hypothetical protein